ncbi:hypothetical protein [Streptomyces sp. NBC_01092]|uniref:hypothetical protein n=1 Tax=Streptomyces sp. NBC_01092 TaxID=2903748 RepID=UPI00386F1316|nr:hypothetical protein OG254_30520 [Streptomyces sp. NBC_01092]
MPSFRRCQTATAGHRHSRRGRRQRRAPAAVCGSGAARPRLPRGAAPVQPNPPRELRAGWIAPAEEALGIDNSAWLAVFLWTQGLPPAALLTVVGYRVWGRWQTWICAGPLLAALGLADAQAITALLPNLL